MKKVLLIATLILVVLSIANLFDEGLSSEAQALIERVDYKAESEAFIFLLGIGAAPEEDPMEVGRNLLGKYRSLEARDAVEGYQDEEYPRAEMLLPLPDGELFCAASNEECLSTLFKKEYDIKALEEENAVLIDRVKRLQAFGEFNTMTKPSMKEPIPEYHYISRATRLGVLKAISLSREGRTEEALDLLFSKLAVARENIALQDHFVGKMTYADIISELMDVASIILDGKIGVIKVELMPRLSLSEKGLGRVSAREFVSLYHVILNVDLGEPQPVEYKHIFWMLLKRVFYKPNMTTNALVPVFLRIEAYSGMSSKEFAEEVENGDKPDASTSMLRNYIGHAMLSVEEPNWDKYIARLFDIDAKIELFNSVRHYGVAEDKVWNPYYEDEYSFKQGKAVCFRGPFEEEKTYRCLQLEY